LLPILDKAPGHPAEELINIAPDTEVVFRLTNITSLLQPLDQCVDKRASRAMTSAAVLSSQLMLMIMIHPQQSLVDRTATLITD
jgi:hypothetical protein